MKRNVLISGGSRGIGRACVEEFAKKGYGVAFLYEKNDDAAKKTAEDCGALAIKCDVGDPEAVRGAMATVK